MDEEYQDELNIETEVEVEAFMIEERETELDVCANCSKLRNGSKVCGMFKPLDTFRKSKGIDNTVDTFSCNEFTE